jgi:hypothetical protein
MRRLTSHVTVAFLVVLPAVPLRSDEPGSQPATVAEAARVLNLEAFQLPAGAKPSGQPRLAGLEASVKATARNAYASVKQTLESRSWKTLAGEYLSDQSCSGTFGKDGFVVSVSTSPSFDSQAPPGTVNIFMFNHGNVDLGKLPVPAGAKPLYAFPSTRAYVTDVPPTETAEALRKLLTAQGWQPYGDAGDSRYFKKNAVKLSARTFSAPGQEGRTVIDLTSELLSVDLPAPPELLRAQYSDSTRSLSLDTRLSSGAFVAFYRDVLGKSGWKPTTENVIKDRFQSSIYFINSAKDLVGLHMQTFEGNLRATVKYQTAAEVEEEGRRARIAAEKAKAITEANLKKFKEEMERKIEKVQMGAPVGAKGVERKDDALNFKLKAGTAKAAVEAIRNELLGKGWKADPSKLRPESGLLMLKKNEGRLTIVYTDIGFDDATVTIDATSAVIQSPAEK